MIIAGFGVVTLLALCGHMCQEAHEFAWARRMRWGGFSVLALTLLIAAL